MFKGTGETEIGGFKKMSDISMSKMNRIVVFIQCLCVAAVAKAGSYELTEASYVYCHAVQGGKGVETTSNSYAVRAPPGMVAKVTLERDADGLVLRNCGRGVFNQYVNGSARTLFGQTTEFLSDATISLSATASDPDVSWTELYVDYYFYIAGVKHPHYHHRYHYYDTYYYRCNYRISVSYEKLLPDLVVSDISLSSADAAVDEAVKLAFKVRNAGRKDAENPSVARIYDGTKKIGSDVPIGALRAGESSAKKIKLPKLPAGMHTLKVVVDATGEVEESYESNNSATIALRDYERVPVRVKFKSNCSGKGGERSVVAGNAVGELPLLSRKGYVFLGWWTEKSGGYQISKKEKITMARTFYAHWAPIECKIELNVRGGGGGDVTAVATYGLGLPLVSPPARTGYSFGGYWTKEDGTGVQYYASDGSGTRTWDIALASATLYAKWIGLTAEVALDSQKGVGGTDAVTVRFGSPLPSVRPPTRTGWVFQGYYSSEGGEGIRYYDQSGKSLRVWDLINGTKSLYAHWLPAKINFSLSLDRQGGTGGSASVGVTYAALLPRVDVPTREGHVFGGYFSEPNGGGTRYYDDEGAGVRTCDLTEGSARLYAKWTRAYHVILDPNGASGTRRTQYLTKRVCQLPERPYVRQGHVLAGWAFEPDGIPVFADGGEVRRELLGYGDDPDAAEITLYAVWGKPLTSKSFPDIMFVTGGSGPEPGWHEEDGVLKSPVSSKLSWLCAAFDGRTDLHYVLQNDRVDCATCNFVWTGGFCLYTNECPGVSEETVSLPCGRRLAVWSCSKDLDLEWMGETPTEDLAELQQFAQKLEADLEVEAKVVIGASNYLIGQVSRGDWYKEDVETAVRRVLSRNRSERYPYVTCTSMRSAIAGEGLDTSYFFKDWLGDVATRLKTIEAACSRASVILTNLSMIDRYAAGCCALSGVTQVKSALLSFSTADYLDLDKALLKSREIEERELNIEEATKGIILNSEALVRECYRNWSDYYRKDLETAVRDYISSCRARNDILRLSGISGAIANNAGLDTTYFHKDWIYEYVQKTKAIEGLCDEIYGQSEAINVLKREILELGVLEWRTVPCGSSVGSLPVPESSPGITLGGWWTAPTGGKRISESTKVDGDATFYLRQNKNTYTLEFDSSGGNGHWIRTVGYGEQIGSLPVPTRAGHAFAGWYDAKSGGESISEDMVVESDKKAYAHWTAVTDWAAAEVPEYEWLDPILVVSLDPKGGTVSGGGARAKGEMVSLKAKAKSGYFFAGWFVDSKAKTALNPTGYDNHAASVEFASPGVGMTVYAKFVTKSSDKKALKFSDATQKLATSAKSYTAGKAMAALAIKASSASLPTLSMKDLPKGMSFDPATGEITGKPTVPGKYTATVTVKSAAGNAISQKVKIYVTVPSGYYGTFDGYALVKTTPAYVTFTSDKYGAVSGKVTYKGKGYPFKANYSSTSSTKSKFTPKIKIGSTIYKPTVTVEKLADGITVSEARGEQKGKFIFVAQKKPGLIKSKKALAGLIDQPVKISNKQYADAKLPKSSDKLTLKFAATDVVKVTGKLKGKSVSFSTTVIYCRAEVTEAGDVYTAEVALIEPKSGYSRLATFTLTVGKDGKVSKAVMFSKIKE